MHASLHLVSYFAVNGPIIPTLFKSSLTFVVPLNVEARGVDDGQLLVTWSLSTTGGELTPDQGFRVQLEDIEATANGVAKASEKALLNLLEPVNLSHTAREYKFEGLKPYNPYRASVQLCKDDGSNKGAWICDKAHTAEGKTLTNSKFRCLLYNNNHHQHRG